MRRQVSDAHPGQDEKATVVSNQTEVVTAMLLIPTNEFVARPDVAWRRRPREARHGSLASKGKKLQVHAHRLRVSKVMMCLNETSEELIIGSAPDLPQFQWNKVPDRTLDGRLIDFDCVAVALLEKGIGGPVTHRRERNMSSAVEREHQPAADHVPQRPVWLSPVPQLTQSLAEVPATRTGIVRDDSLYPLNVHGTD